MANAIPEISPSAVLACADCMGIDGGLCARHAGQCIGCGSESTTHPDPHIYADGITAFWCDACDPDWEHEYKIGSERAAIQARLEEEYATADARSDWESDR